MSAHATIRSQVRADTPDEDGWYVSFDENPDAEDSDWAGPFETYEAAEDYVTSIIEAAAADAVRSMFN